MKMNKIIYIALAISLFCACEKNVEKGKNDNNKSFFEAWIKINHPNATKTPLGAYIIEDIPGTGAVAGSSTEHPYVRVNFTVRTLEGEVTNTTDEALAKQVGTYSLKYNYIPITWIRSNNNLLAGVDEMVSTMKVGGKKKTIIPGWLFTTERYKTAEEYQNKEQFAANAIYEVELLDVIKDIKQYELDSLKRYVNRVYGNKAIERKEGFYYVQHKAPKDTVSFPEDTTIYINYVARLLNGKVFDTNIADTAKYHSIYRASTTYQPGAIKWKKNNYKEITLQSNTVIDGFAYLVSKMRRNEKASGIFVSSLGYGASGSGSTVPEYSPLIFEIEIVDKK